MILAEDNYGLAKKNIGKKYLFWTDDKRHKSNVYIGILKNVSDMKYYYEIDLATKRLKEERVESCYYLSNKEDSCFEFCEIYKEKDSTGNYLLDFI